MPGADALTSGPSNAALRSDDRRVAHSVDFHSVVWFGRSYEFTHGQAACVKVLWQAWKNGTPVVGGHAILEQAGLAGKRFDLIFRGHPAWRKMIVAGLRRGNYRLAER